MLITQAAVSASFYRQVVWEYLLFLPKEIRLLRKRKFTTPVILLFAVRSVPNCQCPHGRS